MATKVNIPRSVVDPNYRYSMPLLEQRIEGKGINIHTTLLNLDSVAKALRTNKDYILKFFGYELSIQVNNKNGDIYLNGEIQEEDVLKVLDKFIEKYILCAKCRLPEMFILVNKERTALVGTCYSCAFKTPIDRAHKLSGYILKNPPQNQSEFKNLRDDNKAFEQVDAKDLEKNTERRRLILKVRNSPLLPGTEESQPVFDEIQAYLEDGFPMTKEYVFDPNHVENLYKLVKRLRLDKDKWDRIGFILFRHIFDVDTIKDLKNRPVLFQKVLHRHNFGSFVSHELLLNIQWLYYETNKQTDHSKIIPTRLAKLMDQQFIEEVT